MAMQLYYLTLDAIVKEAYIEDLQAQNFLLERRVRDLTLLRSDGPNQFTAALKAQIESLQQQLHQVWTQKNEEIALLKTALAKRPVLTAPDHLVEAALKSERDVLRSYAAYSAPTCEFSAESIGAAFTRAGEIIRTAVLRRLGRVARR